MSHRRLEILSPKGSLISEEEDMEGEEAETPKQLVSMSPCPGRTPNPSPISSPHKSWHLDKTYADVQQHHFSEAKMREALVHDNSFLSKVYGLEDSCNKSTGKQNELTIITILLNVNEISPMFHDLWRASTLRLAIGRSSLAIEQFNDSLEDGTILHHSIPHPSSSSFNSQLATPPTKLPPAHFLITDCHGLKEHEIHRLTRAGTDIIQSPDQVTTDLQKAFNYLLELKVKQTIKMGTNSVIVISGADQLRFDKKMSMIHDFLYYQGLLGRIIALSDGELIEVLKKGKNMILPNEILENISVTKCSIIPLDVSGSDSTRSTSGLEWNQENESSLSISNRIAARRIMLDLNGNCIWTTTAGLPGSKEHPFPSHKSSVSSSIPIIKKDSGILDKDKFGQFSQVKDERNSPAWEKERHYEALPSNKV